MSTLPAGTEPGSLFLEACADKGPFAGRSLGGAACPHSLHTPPWEPMLLAVQHPPPPVVGLLESVLGLRAGSSCHTPACSLPLGVGSHRGSEGSRDVRQKPGRGPCLSL